jgi:hypothetical protein
MISVFMFYDSLYIDNKNCWVIIEDGKIIRDFDMCTVLWSGQFSVARRNGDIIKFLTSLNLKNVVFAIHRSDGNITRKNHNFGNFLDKLILYCKNKKKVFILCSLAQRSFDDDYDCLLLPLDDYFFNHGCYETFHNSKDHLDKLDQYLIPDEAFQWNKKSDLFFWRGGLSGHDFNNPLRLRFVKKMYDFRIKNQVRLGDQWLNGRQIDEIYFADKETNRVPYHTLMGYKIFFVVEGNCIASSHMWAFATGSLVFMICNAKCWFSHLLIPDFHYIHIDYDLGNLYEKLEWVINNPVEAKKIAENGLNFSKNYFSATYQKLYLLTEINRIVTKNSN